MTNAVSVWIAALASSPTSIASNCPKDAARAYIEGTTSESQSKGLEPLVQAARRAVRKPINLPAQIEAVRRADGTFFDFTEGIRVLPETPQAAFNFAKLEFERGGSTMAAGLRQFEPMEQRWLDHDFMYPNQATLRAHIKKHHGEDVTQIFRLGRGGVSTIFSCLRSDGTVMDYKGFWKGAWAQIDKNAKDLYSNFFQHHSGAEVFSPPPSGVSVSSDGWSLWGPHTFGRSLNKEFPENLRAYLDQRYLELLSNTRGHFLQYLEGQRIGVRSVESIDSKQLEVRLESGLTITIRPDQVIVDPFTLEMTLKDPH